MLNAKVFSRRRLNLVVVLVILLAGFLLTFTACQDKKDPSQLASDTSTGSETADLTENDEDNAAESTVETTLEPTTAPPPPLEQLLPQEELVENYFGPLTMPEVHTPLERNQLRALYVGAASNLDAAIAIANSTEVNSVVIDLKESDGIKYNSSVPLAIEIGVVQPAYDLQAVLDKLHAADVKVIGRIVCFKDPLLAKAKPDLSIRDQAGNQLLFTLEGNNPFVDPYNKDVWQYNLDLALEAIEFGVDEIQFDYVRFPTGGTVSGTAPYFGEENEVPSRVQAINRFLQVSSLQIQYELGIPLGADIFGIVLSSKLDGNNIGQDWETLGLTGVDNLAPMIYPSHYANASSGHYTGNGVGTELNGVLFTKPDFEPYDVMYHALQTGKEATEQTGYAVNRPYLQAFTATYLPEGYYKEYTAADIKAQINAIYDAGYSEWICWNPYAVYPASAFYAE